MYKYYDNRTCKLVIKYVQRNGRTERFIVMEIIKMLKNNTISDEQLKILIENGETEDELFKEADMIRRKNYGTSVYIRGLIEFTNYCKNDCYYCGIRCSSKNTERYRLTPEEILKYCDEGYALGFRTFVLQRGEDLFFTDKLICNIVSKIKSKYNDCAVTLSIGEKSYESYKSYFDAGADRYLLRHETADTLHYGKLHPNKMSVENRKKCLKNLKEIGYQVGSGFMVGSPFQTTKNIISDLRFLQELKPDMIGIGPFIAHKKTPFAEYKNGDLHICLRLIAILRLLFPFALIPATTALGTLNQLGRELGLKAGANVVMPNLSPVNVRKLYQLYDNKICTGDESAQCRKCLEMRVKATGYKIVTDRGDVKRNI